MKKQFKKYFLSLVLSICLILLSISPAAAETSVTAIADETAIESTESVSEAVLSEPSALTEKSLTLSELPDNIKNLLSSESANSKVYLYSGSFAENGEPDPMELYTIRTEDPDTGTGKLIIHSTPVKYIDGDGNLQYIDTSIKTLSDTKESKSEYAYENVANGFTVRFANTANKGINFNNAFTFEAKSASALKTAARIGAEKGNGKIVYPGAFGADTVIEYINTEGGIKENIILYKYTGQNRFEFIFRSDTHIPVLENNGANILVVKKDDPKAVEYRFLSLYAYDSYIPENDAAAEAETFRHMNEDLYYELSKNADGSYTITVVVPNEYLTNSDIVYPVIIDPSMTYVSFDDRAQDTFVDASTPSTQNNGSLDYIRFGKKGGYKHYGFQRFTSLPNLPAGANITNAYIRFTFRNGQNTPTASSGIKMESRVISSAQWYENTVTWNNKPTGVSAWKTSNFVYNGSYLNYFDVNLKNQVINWYSGISNNYGICFTYYQEDHSDYNSVASCEGSSDRSPKLTIEYELNGLSTGTYYYIRNANSGLYLTASGDSSGDNLIQSPFNGGDSQKFNLLYLAQRGDYWMYPKSATDLAVEIEGNNSANYANIQLGSQPSIPESHQRFKIVKNYDGTFTLLTRRNDYLSAIAVKDWSTSNGAAIIQYTAEMSASRWYIEEVNTTGRSIVTNSNLSVNSGYNRENAATYARTYALSHNQEYEYLKQNCTNFVSQCLYAGGIPMVPNGATWPFTDKEDASNWFYLAATTILGYDDDWVSHSFSYAPTFYEHWGPSKMRAYQVVEYESGADALNDIDFLMNYLKKGDVIQLRDSSGNIHHTIIIYEDNVECDGKHYGEESTCSNNGKKEMLYATNTYDYLNGHLRRILAEQSNNGIVFIKIKQN